MGWSEDVRSLELAQASAQHAITADPLLPTGHRLCGSVYLWQKQHTLAIQEVEHALALDQNDAESYCSLGETFNCAGRPEDTPALIVYGELELCEAAGAAGAAGAAIARVSPRFSRTLLEHRLPYQDPAVVACVLHAAGNVGCPKERKHNNCVCHTFADCAQ